MPQLRLLLLPLLPVAACRLSHGGFEKPIDLHFKQIAFFSLVLLLLLLLCCVLPLLLWDVWCDQHLFFFHCCCWLLVVVAVIVVGFLLFGCVGFSSKKSLIMMMMMNVRWRSLSRQQSVSWAVSQLGSWTVWQALSGLQHGSLSWLLPLASPTAAAACPF